MLLSTTKHTSSSPEPKHPQQEDTFGPIEVNGDVSELREDHDEQHHEAVEHAKDDLALQDGVDDPEDVGAERVRTSGAGNEVLLGGTGDEQGRRPVALKSPTAPTKE